MGKKEVQILKKKHSAATPKDEVELLKGLPHALYRERAAFLIMDSTWNLCADITNSFVTMILAKLEEALADFENYITSKDGDNVYLAEAQQTIKEAKRMIDEYVVEDKTEEG